MKFFWKLYSLLFLTIVLNNALQLFDKNYTAEVYYHTTMIFNNWFIIPYLLNILNALLSGIVAVMILTFAYDIHPLPRLPAWLLYARILSDCTGHSYEWQIIQAGFTQNTLTGLLGLGSLIIPLLPSYLAQWRMTFFL